MEMRPTASNNVHTDSQSRLKKVNQLRNHLWLSINSGEMIKTDF